ncbi:MAG: hypothetical protein R2932_60210 [Caldilineaceae bacterium]
MTHISENVDEQLRLLLGYPRPAGAARVVTMESILEPGQAGVYPYMSYGQLLQHTRRPWSTVVISC